VVATAVGVRPFDVTSAEDNALLPDLPEIEAPHGRSIVHAQPAKTR
jgi:hypothetical protein